MKKGARFLCYAQKDGIACEVCMEVRLTGANQGHMLACGPGADGNWAQEGLGIAIVGLCLSVSGGKTLRANNLPAGVATAGLVLGIIAVVFTAIAFFTCGLCIICAESTAAGLASLA